MTPAYQKATEVPLNLSAHTRCLHCDVSGMRPPLGGTENRDAMPLFTQSGVSCERCHGPGAEHVKGGSIVNPAKLAPARPGTQSACSATWKGAFRSSVPPGRFMSFDPAILLPITSAITSCPALARKCQATECRYQLPRSPFFPSARERVTFFRGRCLACHGAEFGTKHHIEQKDCAVCHMPASPSRDVAHTQVNDHHIPRRPKITSQGLPSAALLTAPLTLIPFPDLREARRSP
jgi:hypothetical protein